VVLTPLAKIATRAHGVAPASTTRLLALTCRLLPDAGERPERAREGARIHARENTTVVDRLATLNERAAVRWNQP
jgi:hypothetical protein